MKPISQWKEQLEIEAYQQATASALDAAQERHLATQQAEPGFFGKLIGKVLDNIQLTIRGLSVRVQD